MVNKNKVHQHKHIRDPKFGIEYDLFYELSNNYDQHSSFVNKNIERFTENLNPQRSHVNQDYVICSDNNQKDEIKSIFQNISGYGVLDYVTCWYNKALDMIDNTTNRCAFVSTNSIIQGEQSSILWHYLFSKFNVSIFFAHKTFKWKNNAKNNAGVHCVIIGLSSATYKPKKI